MTSNSHPSLTFVSFVLFVVECDFLYHEGHEEREEGVSQDYAIELMKTCTKHRSDKVMLVLCVWLFLALPQECPGYILPAEEIIRSVASQVSRFESLLVEQVVRQTMETGSRDVTTYRERVMMKAPDSFITEVLEGSLSPGIPRPDSRYRILFLLNSAASLTRLLRDLGIDLQQVTYAGLERYIAYRIGGVEPESPQILVEKDTFLPLHLVYTAPETGSKVKVHFRDYRRAGGRWYPFQVTLTQGGALTLHTVRSLQPDVTFLFPFGGHPRKAAPSPAGPSAPWDQDKEERVRQLIRAFEEM